MILPAEANILIEGQPLSQAEAMTLRVAVTSFLTEMNEQGSLGNDEVGLAIAEGYRRSCISILKKLKVLL